MISNKQLRNSNFNHINSFLEEKKNNTTNLITIKEIEALKNLINKTQDSYRFTHDFR